MAKRTKDVTIKSCGTSNADLIRQLMNGWNTIESAAKRQFPGASPEEIYQITAGAMNHSLKIKA
jgi:hypothetical protein